MVGRRLTKLLAGRIFLPAVETRNPSFSSALPIDLILFERGIPGRESDAIAWRRHERERCVPGRQCEPANGGDGRRGRPCLSVAVLISRAPGRKAAAPPGLTFPRFFTEAGRRSVRRGRMGTARRADRQRAGRTGIRAAGRRDSEILVAAGHQHRRLQIFPRADWRAGTRTQRQAADWPRRQHDHGVGEGRQVFRER